MMMVYSKNIAATWSVEAKKKKKSKKKKKKRSIEAAPHWSISDNLRTKINNRL